MATLFQPDIQLFPLRGRQPAAIEGIRKAIREGHKRIILQAPTGSGKTVIAAHIIAGALSKGKLPLFAVPQLSLIDQTVKRFESQGITDIGVIQAQHHRTDRDARVQVASIQTLVRRPIPDVDIVLIDEVHLQWEALNKILDSEEWKNKIVIGLSATPWAKGMGLRWTKLVLFGSTNEMIEEGWLAPLIAFGVPDEFSPDLSQVRTVAGEYVEGDAEKAMSTQKIVGNVVKTWILRGILEKTFIFCVNRSHAKKMQEEFNAAGYPCGYIDGLMDADQREAVFKKYRSGEYKLIASVGCLVVGVDEDVRVIIFLVLTKSEMKWVQAGGRGLRLADQKSFLVLHDHSGTSEALGLFTDIHHEHLDISKPGEKPKPKEKEPPKPRKCPKCSALVPKGVTSCPVCGSSLIASNRGPAVVEGELVEIKGKKSKKDDPTPAQKEEWYSQLIHIADEKGRKRGWADWTFKEKFGHFPSKKQGINPTPPSLTVLNYVRSRNIAKAKAREKA